MTNFPSAYCKLKAQYPDAILLWRIGDFYEAFDEDADAIACVLSLAKTTCGEHRVAGFPHMHLDCFLTALVGVGFRVAIAEQQGDTPQQVRGLRVSGQPRIVCKEVPRS